MAKPSEEFYEELQKENKIWRERLAMQPKTLVELVRSGELRPPQEINTCQLTDDALLNEINELEYNIFRLIEDYCTDKGFGFVVYDGIADYVRKLTACAWVAGRRNLKAKERADHGEEITKRCERFWRNEEG